MATNTPDLELDRYDRLILQLLQNDAGISNLELADRIDLSPTPCARRVKALEKRGLIDRRVALLNRQSLGLDMMAIVQVTLERHTPDHMTPFEARIRQHPNVLECFLMTGQAADYTLKVVVNDMQSYRHFLLDELTPMPGVKDVQSSFVLDEIVNSTALPLP